MRPGRAGTYALVTGGGTGGHVYPGLALAEALVARGHPRASVHWVGSAGKLEETAVPAAGFTIDVLPGRGLQRRFTVENLSVVVKTTRAFGRAMRIVRRRRPEVVVGVGGYASLPCLVAARLQRIPAVGTAVSSSLPALPTQWTDARGWPRATSASARARPG